MAELRDFQRVTEHVGHLIAELDASRGASSAVQERLFTSISRELSQLRQRALASGIGGVDERAGAMSVLARAGLGLNFKLRALAEGIASLDTEIDLEIRRSTARPLGAAPAKAKKTPPQGTTTPPDEEPPKSA